jgi:hypothetical protein
MLYGSSNLAVVMVEKINRSGGFMPSTKQRAAARRNIKKAATAARRKPTIAHLPKSTRIALGKQTSKVARSKRTAA